MAVFRRPSFSEEKEAKRLLILRNSKDRGYCPDIAASFRIKVFLLLFLQKKKTFLQPRGDRGFALLIVLWAMVLLALLGTQVTGAGRAETRLATALRTGAQLQEAADAAVYETIWHMLDGGGDYWPPGAMTRVLNEPAGRVVVKVTDDRGKFDINQVPPGFLQSLFSMLGADKDTATTLANAVTDWRSQQPGGAGVDTPLTEQYRGAGRVWGPSGEEFQRLDDLNLVLGMTAALAKAAKPYLTLALEQGPWLKYASPVVLAAMEKA
jgi:general secretion pathway protein K